MTRFRTVEELAGDERLLVRLDLNAPIEDGQVQSTKRFERHAETVRGLLDRGHALAIMAHQGRPGDSDFTTLEGHAAVLGEHAGADVAYVPDTYGERALDAVEALGTGEALLLENVRMTDDELPEKPPSEHADSEFVRTLAPEFDAYVNDAYSAAHRSHASLVGFPVVMDAYAGPVLVEEYEYNTAVREREFDGRVTMVLGGTKADDLVAVMDGVSDTVDSFLMGGVIAELFLRAEGYDVGYDVDGTDLFDDQWEANESEVRRLLEEYREDILLPADLACRDDAGARAEAEITAIEKDRPYLDVGAGTVESYDPVLAGSEAVFVKGALGVFEDEAFAFGTRRVLERVAATDCFSVVGGGDTARAVDLFDLAEDDFSHISVAGGAYVRALAGQSLPAVDVLRR